MNSSSQISEQASSNSSNSSDSEEPVFKAPATAAEVTKAQTKVKSNIDQIARMDSEDRLDDMCAELDCQNESSFDSQADPDHSSSSDSAMSQQSHGRLTEDSWDNRSQDLYEDPSQTLNMYHIYAKPRLFELQSTQKRKTFTYDLPQ